MARYRFAEIEAGVIIGEIDYTASNRNINSIVVIRSNLAFLPTFIARDTATGAVVYQETLTAGAPSPTVRTVPGGYKMQTNAEGELLPPFNLELVA